MLFAAKFSPLGLNTYYFSPHLQWRVTIPNLWSCLWLTRTLINPLLNHTQTIVTAALLLNELSPSTNRTSHVHLKPRVNTLQMKHVMTFWYHLNSLFLLKLTQANSTLNLVLHITMVIRVHRQWVDNLWVKTSSNSWAGRSPGWTAGCTCWPWCARAALSVRIIEILWRRRRRWWVDGELTGVDRKESHEEESY